MALSSFREHEGMSYKWENKNNIGNNVHTSRKKGKWELFFFFFKLQPAFKSLNAYEAFPFRALGQYCWCKCFHVMDDTSHLCCFAPENWPCQDQRRFESHTSLPHCTLNNFYGMLSYIKKRKGKKTKKHFCQWQLVCHKISIWNH